MVAGDVDLDGMGMEWNGHGYGYGTERRSVNEALTMWFA